MTKVLSRTIAVSALALGLASPALAQRSATGSVNGLGWTATNRIVGQTGTGTQAAVPPGNPIYNATMPQKSGVAALIMQYENGAFICTGSLISATRIVTAAHCVSGGQNYGGLSGLQSVTAHFYAGNNPGQPGNVYNPDVVTSNPASPFGDAVNTVSIGAAGVNVHQDYTGEVIDQNDLAVIVLSQAAPDWANVYGIDYSTPLAGANFNVAGYGGRSSLGGSVGADLGTGRLREGDNRYDFRLGDADFNGEFTDPVIGFGAQAENSWLSDFDNGLATNDASCRLAVEGFGIAPSGKYCDLGRGAREVGVAGGDSGGPQFIDGRLSSVTSYGLTFYGLGDIDCLNPAFCNLNSTFGEFSGYVPLSIHEDFINAAIPEPQSWALMILGFGLAGFGMRRSQGAKVSFA